MSEAQSDQGYFIVDMAEPISKLTSRWGCRSAFTSFFIYEAVSCLARWLSVSDILWSFRKQQRVPREQAEQVLWPLCVCATWRQTYLQYFFFPSCLHRQNGLTDRVTVSVSIFCFIDHNSRWRLTCRKYVHRHQFSGRHSNAPASY